MIRNLFKILILLFVNSALTAQVDSSQFLLFRQIYSAAEREYGIDQELMNGFLMEVKNQNATGHPYLLDYYSNEGSLIYRGKHYSNLFLRYDIYDQEVLLIYRADSTEYKLHLHKEFITEFTVGKKKFIKETFGTRNEARFYQVIGEDLPVKLVRFRQKGLTNIYANNSDSKRYSENNKTYILLHDDLIEVNGNRSFTRNFSSTGKTAIRKYFRENNIRINQATDYEMEELIAYINTLST